MLSFHFHFVTHANSNRTISVNDAYNQHVWHLSPLSTSGVCFWCPKMAPHGASVCASSLFWNEETNEGCAAHSLYSAKRRWAIVFPSCQGSKELLIQSLFFRPVPVVRAGITLLITTSWFVVFFARNPRHAWAIAVGHTCLSACVHLRDLYPVELRASSGKTMSISAREEETESKSCSATAGSEITNSIVLCWVTRLLGNFLLATSHGRGVCRSRRMWREAMLPVLLIFLCVHFRKECSHSHLIFITIVWVVLSGSNVSVLITFMPFHSLLKHFSFMPFHFFETFFIPNSAL